MITFSIPSLDELDQLSRLPTIAVDVGFGNSSSSGIATSMSDETFTKGFASCADVIADRTSSHDEVNLILEAPLTGTFDAEGNPDGRRPLEKKGSSTRYWYLQAGANVGIGALFLLRDLSARAVDAKVNLFEGFVSFKTETSEHVGDAQMLLREFQKGQDGDIRTIEEAASDTESASFVSFLDLIGAGSATTPPPIVVANAPADAS
jgi:hypothetical protein